MAPGALLAATETIVSSNKDSIKHDVTDGDAKHEDEQTSSGFSESFCSHGDLAILEFGLINPYDGAILNGDDCFEDIMTNESNGLTQENDSIDFNVQLPESITDDLHSDLRFTTQTQVLSESSNVNNSFFDAPEMLEFTSENSRGQDISTREDDDEFLFSECMSCINAVNVNLTVSSESTLTPTGDEGRQLLVDFTHIKSASPCDMFDDENSIFNILPQSVNNNDSNLSKAATVNNYISTHTGSLVQHTQSEANVFGDNVSENVNFKEEERGITNRTRSCLIDYKVNKVQGSSATRVVKFADEMGFALDDIHYLTPPNDYLTPILLMESVNDKVESLFRQVRPHRVLTPLFDQPNSLPQFERILERQMVVLEYTFSNCMSIYGAVQVKNISFEKEIVIRYTIDNWKTSRNLKATHSHHHNNTDSDSFSFYYNFSMWSLNLKQIEFAVQYCANGHEYWDNNNNKNYKLLCRFA